MTEFIPGETYIPVAKAVYDQSEIDALVEAAEEFAIVDGKRSSLFEKSLSRFIGTRYGVFVNSGSSANLLAMMTLTSKQLGDRRLKPGDEVITAAVGFPTTVAPIIQAGCIPSFIDSNYGTYNPSSFQIAEAITEKTKAIFLAHTLGNPLNIKEIMDIATQNELWVIEDCADALGGKFGDKRVGTFGHIATTSFYPAHMMTTGEGGMVFTDSPLLNKITRSFRDWGRDCWCPPGKDNTCGKRFSWEFENMPNGFDHKYIYSHVGFNLKSTDLQASIGLEQLKKLPFFIERRKHNWNLLLDTLIYKGLDKYFILPSKYIKSEPAWFGFILTLKDNCKFSRNDVTKYLEEKKIGTRNLFAGNITRHPAFLGLGIIPEDGLPKADKIMERTFWVGVHPAITDEMINYVVETLEEFVHANS